MVFNTPENKEIALNSIRMALGIATMSFRLIPTDPSTSRLYILSILNGIMKTVLGIILIGTCLFPSLLFNIMQIMYSYKNKLNLSYFFHSNSLCYILIYSFSPCQLAPL